MPMQPISFCFANSTDWQWQAAPPPQALSLTSSRSQKRESFRQLPLANSARTRLEQPAAARHLLFESAEHPVIQVEPDLKSSRRSLEIGLQMVQPHSRLAMPQW